MRKQSLKFSLFVLLAMLCLPLAVKAAPTSPAQDIYISKGETREGNVYLVGQNIIVDGNIKGDLISASQSLTVNGQVGGDIIAVAQILNLNGPVAGNVRAAGRDLNLNASVQKNINLAGSQVNFNEAATSGGDLIIAAATTNVRGSVAENFYGYGDFFNIGGKFGQNVYLKTSANSQANLINLSSETIINGDFNYRAKTAANIANPAAISGQITHEPAAIKAGNETVSWLWRRLYALFSALIVGLVLITLFKKKIINLDQDLKEKSKKAIWPGIIALIITPIVIIILAFTFIGLPLALILLLLWLVALYLAKIIIALVAGLWLTGKFFPKEKANLILVLILGVTASWILFSLPYIGCFLAFIATLLGLGVLYLLKKENY